MHKHISISQTLRIVRDVPGVCPGRVRCSFSHRDGSGGARALPVTRHPHATRQARRRVPSTCCVARAFTNPWLHTNPAQRRLGKPTHGSHGPRIFRAGCPWFPKVQWRD
eukprot:gene22854-biopygen16294